MRLLDQIAQATDAVVIEDGAGVHVMPGPADLAPAVAACPLRYVLDAEVTALCAQVRPDVAAIARMPAPNFWVEWREADGRRSGLLVEADPGGRRGRFDLFWEQAGGPPDRAQASVAFDLDDAIAGHADGVHRFALRPDAHPLAGRLLFEVAPPWMAHFAREGGAAALGAVRRLLTDLVPPCETLLALAVLLQARATLETAPVDRTHLNRRRARHRRPALLDHLEVRLALGEARLGAGAGGTGGYRLAARRHQVRGHLVQRGGALFWRRAHLRGTAGADVLRRTVLLGPPRRPG